MTGWGCLWGGEGLSACVNGPTSVLDGGVGDGSFGCGSSGDGGERGARDAVVYFEGNHPEGNHGGIGGVL